MQLCQPESLSMLDDHDRGIGYVYPNLNHGRRHQDLDGAGLEGEGHRVRGAHLLPVDDDVRLRRQQRAADVLVVDHDLALGAVRRGLKQAKERKLSNGPNLTNAAKLADKLKDDEDE